MADHGIGGGAPPPGAPSPFDMLTQPIRSSQFAVGPGAQNGKNAPPPPNYGQVATQQHQQSVQDTNAQTNANRPSISTPFGSENWTQGPDGQWHLNTSYSAPIQGILNNLQGQIGKNFSSGMMTGDQARKQAIDASYGQAVSRLNPQWNQRDEQLRAQLANQGLDPNSQAYRTAQQQFGQQRNDAYASAMNNAITNGNQAQALTFGQNLEARNAPLQEMGALQGFLSMPGFNTAGRADPLQSLAAAIAQGNYNLSSSQLNNQAAADMFGGGAGALGGILSLLGGL